MRKLRTGGVHPARPGHAELFWFFRADRCDAVFRDEQAKPRRSVHERAAKSHIYRGFPHDDFAASGDWFWLKSAATHGFDVKAFDQNYVYIRSTELVWSDSTTFKRLVNDLPIADRCVPPDGPGPEIEVADTSFQYFSSCNPYKSSNLGTALNDLDAPALMDTGGNLGQLSTRVLHYRYNCDKHFTTASTRSSTFWPQDMGYGNGNIAKWNACQLDIDKQY